MRTKTKYDVIIVGAGPAGSVCANYLSKEGKKVLLLDKQKFPRDKTCGDALSGKTMKILRELNLIKKVEKLPHFETTGAIFGSPNGSTLTVKFPSLEKKGTPDKGYCMRRIYTDKMFFDAAKRQKNVDTVEKFHVTNVIFEKGVAIGVEGIDIAKKRKEKKFYAKVIVGSDGVNSVVAKKVLGNKYKTDDNHTCDAIRAYYTGITGLSKNMEIYFFEGSLPGYFWIFPVSKNCANVGLGMLSCEVKKKMRKKQNLISIFNDVLTNEQTIKKRFAKSKIDGKITGWRLPFGSYRRQLAGDGWVLLGDAASLVDPFSGEGVGNATTSSKLASRVIVKAIYNDDVSREVLAEYERDLWDEIGSELKINHKLQKLSNNKWLTNRIVSKAVNNKEIRDVISSSFINEDSKKTFQNPFFILKLLI